MGGHIVHGPPGAAVLLGAAAVFVVRRRKTGSDA
ncbi:MYXO-CTERM sorting domain-containing protein [Streptomyces rubiginosohelvolus]